MRNIQYPSSVAKLPTPRFPNTTYNIIDFVKAFLDEKVKPLSDIQTMAFCFVMLKGND